MKPANVPEAIAAAAATARHRVQSHFMALHALSPYDAIEYAPPSPRERKEFERLRRTGAIREAHPAYYWLDLDRLNAEEKRRERNKAPFAIAAAVLLACILMYFYEG